MVGVSGTEDICVSLHMTGGGVGGHGVNTACRCGMSALLIANLQCCSCGCVFLSLLVLGNMKLCKASTVLQPTQKYTVYTHKLSHPTLILPLSHSGDLALVLRVTSWLPESACAAVYCDERYSTTTRTQWLFTALLCVNMAAWHYYSHLKYI